MSVLELRDLTVDYASRAGRIRAVDQVGFSIAKGTTVGLVGESGCGKSTLGKAILRILPETAKVTGEIRFDGKDLLHLPDREVRKYRGRQVSLIFQDPMTRLNPLMTIGDHFVEAVQAHDPETSADEALSRARKVLADVRIPGTRLTQYPHELSGGMRQRIMIALALVFNPTLLIADEPTTSLDVIVEAQILELLEEIKSRYDVGVLLITHNLALVAEYAEECAVMYAGKLAEFSSVDTLFADPLHPYTKGLLESTIHLESTRLQSIPGQPPDLLHPPSGCPFHPRCPSVMPECREVMPPRTEPKPGRQVACYLYPS